MSTTALTAEQLVTYGSFGALAHPIRFGASSQPNLEPPGHTPPPPPQLVWARRASDEGPALAELGKPKPKNRLKDEAPPLARRRVGAGLSVAGAWSFLACGGGVSFRFWYLRCLFRFGVFSFARRGALRFVVARSVSAPAVRSGSVRRAGAATRGRGVVTLSGVLAQRTVVGLPA